MEATALPTEPLLLALKQHFDAIFQGLTMDESMEVDEAGLANQQLVPQTQQIILGDSHNAASVSGKVLKLEPVVRKIQPQIKLVSNSTTSGTIRIVQSGAQGTS